MTEVQRLNKWLATQGASIDGKTLYRLIWSEHIHEHRHGLFRDFTDSGLFIREVKETRLVRKYNYINERWILEKWAPGNLTAHKELPDALSGDYIPVYVFEDKHGNYLAPTEKVLQLILDFMIGKIRKPDEESQEAIEEKEIAYQMEELSNHPSFSTYGDTRNAVGYTKDLKNV